MGKEISHLIIYGKIFFGNFVNFLALLLLEIYIFDIFNMANFVRFLLYRKVLKLSSYQTFGWESIRKAFLNVDSRPINLNSTVSQCTLKNVDKFATSSHRKLFKI